jgi:hypothetical protein
MQDKEERWFKLCQQAAVEKDSEKLMQLVKEINELLEAREKQRQQPEILQHEKAS